MKRGYVYITASQSGVLYTGVTNNLIRRITEHREKTVEGFTKEYNATRLVHYQRFEDIRNAIAREKQIKGWLRAKKIALIESSNPKWKDLAENLFPSNTAGGPPTPRLRRAYRTSALHGETASATAKARRRQDAPSAVLGAEQRY